MKRIQKVNDGTGTMGFDYGYIIFTNNKNKCKYCGKILKVPYWYCPNDILYCTKCWKDKHKCIVTGNQEHFDFRIVEERRQKNGKI